MIHHFRNLMLQPMKHHLQISQVYRTHHSTMYFKTLNHYMTQWHDAMTPFSDDGTIKLIKQKTGRLRCLGAKGALELLLTWFWNRGLTMMLCIKFGIISNKCSIMHRFSRRLLLHVLQHRNLAAVRMPSEEEYELYRRAILRRHPLLCDIYATVDSLKLHL